MSNLSQDHNQFGFGDGEFSWDAYDDYRPAYPPGLWSLIFSYHSSKHSQWDSALDIGCGSGAASSTLAHHFQHVTLADPAEHNLESAKTKLTSPAFQSSLQRPCSFSYHTLPGEQAMVDPGTQDMVTIFTAIHWGDAAIIMAQAARALKSGGTIALVNYTPRPTILENPAAQEVWNKIWQAHVFGMCEPDDSKPTRRHFKLAAVQANAGLDFVPLDADLWRLGGRRIIMNCDERGAAALQLCEGDNVPIAERRVVPEQEVLEEIKDAPGWERMVGPEWFREYYWKSFQTGKVLPDDFADRTADLWRKLEQFVREDGVEGGKARIVWPVALVLATRK